MSACADLISLGWRATAALALAMVVASCAGTRRSGRGSANDVLAALDADAHDEREHPSGELIGEGRASYYGRDFDGRRTASGEIFNRRNLTAAHRHLPFGTCVRVVNVTNGREVEVRVNDRGPFVRGRIIDVSEAAARALGMLEAGVTHVRLFRC